jgi:hypothetical protein
MRNDESDADKCQVSGSDPFSFLEGGIPIPDPGGAAGALHWDVSGAFKGTEGTWALVANPQSKIIYHWLFSRVP